MLFKRDIFHQYRQAYERLKVTDSLSMHFLTSKEVLFRNKSLRQQSLCLAVTHLVKSRCFPSPDLSLSDQALNHNCFKHKTRTINLDALVYHRHTLMIVQNWGH